MKWHQASGVLCDKRVPQKLKGKFYRTAIRPAMLYGAECWPTKRRQVQQISAAEMRLRGVLELVDPQERAVYRNLRVPVEAIVVQ